MVTDIALLRDILDKTTQPYRLGAELSAVAIGDSHYLLRHDMPAADELDASFEKIDCGVMGVAINPVQAEIHKKEFALIVIKHFLVSGLIGNGVSARQLAAHSGEKHLVGTCMLAALGAHLGLWKIVLPGDFFSPETLGILSKGLPHCMGAQKRLSPQEIRAALTLEHGFYFASVKS